MLVVEKIFGIKFTSDKSKEDLCGKLSRTCCFDKENYKLNSNAICDENCKFYNEESNCNPRIYDWLISEYETKPDEKYRNACGSCKYFEEVEIANKVWRKCSMVYKRGVHTGERRLCYPAMNKCCDYVRKEEKNDEDN